MRLFVAVRPSTEAADVLDRLPRPVAPRVRWLPRSQWHVTLRFLGDADPGEAAAALGAVPWGEVAPVDVMLGPATALLGGAVVMVPAAGGDDLAARVAMATGHVGQLSGGQPPEDRPFVGHLTLGRFRDEPPPGAIGSPVSISFRADEVLLVASRTLPEGAVHEVVARFPLASEA